LTQLRGQRPLSIVVFHEPKKLSQLPIISQPVYDSHKNLLEEFCHMIGTPSSIIIEGPVGPETS
jgi:hypothetical protein